MWNAHLAAMSSFVMALLSHKPVVLQEVELGHVAAESPPCLPVTQAKLAGQVPLDPTIECHTQHWWQLVYQDGCD